MFLSVVQHIARVERSQAASPSKDFESCKKEFSFHMESDFSNFHCCKLSGLQPVLPMSWVHHCVPQSAITPLQWWKADMTPLRACVDLAFCLLYKITCLPFLSFMAVLVNSVLRWIALQYYTAEACKITEQTFNLANIFECQPSTFDKLPTPNCKCTVI